MQTPAPGFAALFTPKLITTLREGYSLHRLKADVIAGLTVAIVALPLSMAIAVASGASPAQGLYTAIIGGFLVSLLGGSRFQIGGPAGAFIVLVAATIQTHGMSGLLVATCLSGLMLMTIGFLRIGTYIKFIPYPVTVGFTAGIAVIIFASQLKPLLGLSFTDSEPGDLPEKLPFLWQHFSSFDLTTVMVSIATIVIIVGLKRWLPRWPGMLIAVTATALAASLLGLPIATLGTTFGEMPNHLPAPQWPEFSWPLIQAVLPNAVAFTLLGAIESLLSAVVADGMTGRRHRANCELVAQGVANIGSSLFGGLCVTGTIARTATNVRAGGTSPVAGICHAGFVLLFIMIAAPLAAYIPLASLAGVLAVVAWNMIEKQAFASLMKASRADAAVLLSTFGLTLLRDLTTGIVVGCLVGMVLFIHRMAQATAITAERPLFEEDQADELNPPDQGIPATDPDLVIYRLSGACFFGAAASIESVLLRIADKHRGLILDLSGVPFLDSSGAQMLAGALSSAQGAGVRVALTGTTHDMRVQLFAQGLQPPEVIFSHQLNTAIKKLKALLA